MSDLHRTLPHRIERRNATEKLRATGADQACHAENFTTPHVERHVLWNSPAGETRDREQRFARLMRYGGKQVVDAASNHQRNNLRLAHRRQIAAADRLAVAQHGVTIGDLAHFFQKMADVDDAAAGRLESADGLKQPASVLLRERTGRLVEDNHPRVGDQGAGNLDQLLQSDRQFTHRRVQRQVGVS